MTLGRNPFEGKEPLEEKPPVRRRPIVPSVEPPKVEGEIPDRPYTVKDPFTGKDIDFVLKQGMFLWREDKLEGFFTKKGDFITTKPEETSLLEKTGAFLSNMWKELPVNPYFWKSPGEKWEVDRRDALEAWAKESGQENPKEFVEELLTKESGELAFQAFEPEEGQLRIPVSGVGPTGILPHQVPATRFLGEWVIPAAILSGLGLSAIKGRAALQAAKTVKPAVVRAGVQIAPPIVRPAATRAVLEVGRVALAPVAGAEWVTIKVFRTLFGRPLNWAKGKVDEKQMLNSFHKSKAYNNFRAQYPKASRNRELNEAELFRAFQQYHQGNNVTAQNILDHMVREGGIRIHKPGSRALVPFVGKPGIKPPTAPPITPKAPPTVTPTVKAGVPAVIPTGVPAVPKVPTVAPIITPPAVPVVKPTVDEAIKAFEVEQKAIQAKTRYGIDITKATEAEYVKAGLASMKKDLEGTGFPLDIKKQTQILRGEYQALPKPPAVEVTPPEPTIAPVEGVTEVLASTEQKAMAHTLARDKALIDASGKTRQQYRKLAENITGKKSMKDMTSEEASAFIDALEKYPDKKWSAKTGTWIPQAIPITKAIVPENYFNIKFGEPTPIKFFTSQNFYATKLGVGELTRPLELAKQRLDLEYPAWTKAVDTKIRDLNKAYKVTIAEKLIAVRNNIPTRAVSDMAKLLNKYEDLPPDIAAELGEDKVKLFSWFRNVDRTILSGENKVRELLNMPLIPHRKAYLRHIADRTANEIMQGNYSLPQDLAYWSKQIVGKKIFNPMSIQRKLSDDLLEHFSKDLNYITKSMIWTGLKEIHLSQPLQAFATQLNVLSKGNMPFGSLTSEELLRAQAISTLPASTRKWLVDYVNQVIKGQQTELDASVNRVITQTGIGGVLDKLLGEFGRSVGTRPMTVMAQFAGRVNILATIGTKPRQIIRNLFQTTQNLAIYGVTPTLQAELPAGKTLTRLLNNSLFLKSYARYEELPTSAMGKVERAWMWAYGKSAIINARKGMKAAFYPTVDYITNPKNKGLGWADPARTYTEKKGFLYPSEEENLLREMEYGAGATQYQYIAMGMPEIFRHKVLTPITRLQSWWMNYFAKFHREALHRFWTGSVGWNPNLKLPPSARLNWFKYLILGGAVLTAMGYKRSFMKDVLPHWGSPAVQFVTGAYNYVIADSDYARESAKRAMSYSISAFVPGMIDYKSWQAVWTGEKPMSSLFFYGEELPPNMPTWGIPVLEEENEIKRQINYVKDEVPIFKKLLGTEMPSEDGIEEYTYEMSDFASEIRALIRDIPDDRITEFSDIVQMYKRAETMWDTNYYSLPSSDRQEWLQQDTPESIWTGAYLALWGRLKVTGWVSGNPRIIELIKKLVDDFNIPGDAIPSLGELKEGAKDTRKRRPIIPRRTEPTEPTEQPSGSMGVNPFE